MDKVAEQIARRIEVLYGKFLAASGHTAVRYRNQLIALRAYYKAHTGCDYYG